MRSGDGARSSWFIGFLKCVGVVLASALLTGGASIALLFMFNDLLAFGFGMLIGIAVTTATFWSRVRLAVPSSIAGAMLVFMSLLSTMPGPGRDPMRAEAEQMLVAIKGQVRVVYARDPEASNVRTLTGPREAGGCGLTPAELQGKYYLVRDQVTLTETGAILYAEPMPHRNDRGMCTLTFNWEGGDGEFTWSP